MKGLAISSLVLGIVGILTCWIGIGVIPAVLALIFGLIGCFHRELRGMAITGLVLGIIGTGISLTIIHYASHPEKLIEAMVESIGEQAERATTKKEQKVAKMPKKAIESVRGLSGKEQRVVKAPKVIIKRCTPKVKDFRVDSVIFDMSQVLLENSGNETARIEYIVTTIGNRRHRDYEGTKLEPEKEVIKYFYPFSDKDYEFEKFPRAESLIAKIEVYAPEEKLLARKDVVISILKTRMGETLKLDCGHNFLLTLLSWSESNLTVEGPYRGGYYTFTSKAGMKFITLLYKVQNKWVEEQGICGPSHTGKVITDKGYRYKSWSPPAGVLSKEYSPREATKEEINDPKYCATLYKSKLLPGESTKRCVLFEIPTDQTPIEAHLIGLKPLIQF